MTPIFTFKPVASETRQLVLDWLKFPHVTKWFYGEGLENTIKGLDAYLNGASIFDYWLAYDQATPVALFLSSKVNKSSDELTKWCVTDGEAITLDMLIGHTEYLGKGLAHILINQLLKAKFAHIQEVLIDPEATNTRAIHVYKKAGFEKIGEFIPNHSPHPHLMMRKTCL